MSWSDVKSKCTPIRTHEDVEYLNGCARKLQIRSQKVAEKIAKRMAKSHARDFNAYLCKFCELYHVGGYDTTKNKVRNDE